MLWKLAWSVAVSMAVCFYAAADEQVQGQHASVTLPVLMLSDLHFDPFRDPDKVERLVEAPVEQWDTILNEPSSAGQAASYAAMQTACGARGDDSDIALLNASLKGAKAQAEGVGFVIVSGDLLVHLFDCRYRIAMKGKDESYAGFAEKTATYVMRRVEAEFPTTPVYFGLGNNDSGCGDYKMDVQDRFLAGTSGALIAGLRGASAAEVKKAREDYERGGNYAVSLPGVARTRLLVVNDIYLSNKYATCAGKKEGAGPAAELAWLNGELDAARQAGERVWVMGHIPPGPDAYNTLKHITTMCTRAPDTFLETSALARALEQHADVVKLAIFGHTHTDEFRVLGEVPVKLVGSVSPINGNTPSFTVAQVDPGSAMLEDYTVFTASNASGVGTTWSREYDFREAYKQAEFSARALRSVIAEFRANPGGAASLEYERDFYGGEGSPLPLVWTQYVCALDHEGGAAFRDCICAAQ